MKLNPFPYAALAVLLPSLATVACGDDDDDAGSGTISQPLTYQFDSRFDDTTTSVAYSGQVKRHLLIEGLKSYIGGLSDTSFPTGVKSEVVDALVFFHDFKNAGTDADSIPISPPGSLPASQTTWGDLGGSLVSLKEKFPEFDADFTGNVVGYGGGTMTPEEALLDMFDGLADLIVARVTGNRPTDPDGVEIQATFVTAEGVDYQQLIQKYLSGAIAISQGTDDYLDDDVEGKGLLSDNDGPVTSSDGAEAPYTALEHVWDEGFGYFGAARHYADFTDDEIAGAGGRADWQTANDANGDGEIDFLSEYNFGHSVNAAKRDRGSASSATTDYTQTAFDAFLAGRTLIVNAGADLTNAELTTLRGYRDAAVGAWERAVAATAVHYINEVLQDMGDFGTPDYDFLDHAKHWSELKGFALALQFNVNHSPLGATDLADLHAWIDDRPVLPTAPQTEQDDYRSDLLMARALLGQVYQFDAANLGDTDGTNGW